MNNKDGKQEKFWPISWHTSNSQGFMHNKDYDSFWKFPPKQEMQCIFPKVLNPKKILQLKSAYITVA